MKTIRSPVGFRRIVWLASYPKSGNTWVRVLLANFLANSEEPVSINEIREVLPGPSSFSREDFEHFMGVVPDNCTDDEAEMLLPDLYRARAAEAKGPLFCKVHDALRDTSVGEPLFPDDVTLGAVYVMRNPLDVAVSWSFYSGADFSTSIARLNNPGAVAAGVARHLFLQRMFDWSGHVRSWTSAPFPVLIVRYEDLLADGATQLCRMVRFLRLEGASDEGRLRRAVAFSDFARLQRNEEREGFNDHHREGRNPFFRSGKAGDWRRHLSPTQTRMVVQVHGKTMVAFGYDSRNLRQN